VRRSGFTLIELLVVIAIIGLLATISLAPLQSARLHARDAQRVADVKQLRTALDLALSEVSAYPNGANASAILGSTTSTTLCNVGGAAVWQTGTAGCGTVYMGSVPDDPKTGSVYRYAGVTGSYQIYFTLEGPAGSLPAGAACANQNGFQSATGC
jgi:prepilin-type N-terminal cleavage/methylation domain-containing protein